MLSSSLWILSLLFSSWNYQKFLLNIGFEQIWNQFFRIQKVVERSCLDLSVVMDPLMEVLLARKFVYFSFKFHHLLLMIYVLRLHRLNTMRPSNLKGKKKCWLQKDTNIFKVQTVIFTFNISFSALSNWSRCRSFSKEICAATTSACFLSISSSHLKLHSLKAKVRPKKTPTISVEFFSSSYSPLSLLNEVSQLCFQHNNLLFLNERRK